MRMITTTTTMTIMILQEKIVVGLYLFKIYIVSSF